MPVICLDCQEPISPRRLEILPDTEWCVKCADKHTTVMGGFMCWTHKTAPEFILMASERKAAAAESRYGRRRFGAQVSVGSTTSVLGVDLPKEKK